MVVTEDTRNIVQSNGRLEYRLLRQFAKSVPLEEFVRVLSRAVLVGSGIYSSNLEHANQSDQTMLLKNRFVDQDDDASISLHSAIFYLHKQPASHSAPDTITIGRSNSNDLVLNDDPISRVHAHIRFQGERYFITDFGATNRTIHNEKRLEPNREIELQPGDTIGFGRFEFSFMPPERLYKWVHKY